MCPHFVHGAYFEDNAAPQTPQKPPDPPAPCCLCGVPHAAHVGDPDEITAPQLTQTPIKLV